MPGAPAGLRVCSGCEDMSVLEALPRLAAPLRAVARSRLGANLLALYTVQGLNYLLPLIVLPYLLRVLGPVSYGAIVFAQSLVGYLIVLTDFGFNLTATREVSLSREDPQRLAQIFWTTLACKAGLLAVGIAVALPLITLVPSLAHHASLIGVCGLLVLGNVVLPQWYFQGLEKMRTLAVSQVVAKAVSVAATFLLVRSPADTVTAGAILSMPSFLAGLLCLLAVRFIAPVPWRCPTVGDIKAALTAAWPLFFGSCAASLYVTSNAFLLGLICGDRAVALYGVGNRVTGATFGVLTPVMQAIYPRTSVVFGRSPAEGRAYMKRLLRWLAPPAGALSLALFLGAPLIVRLLGGHGYEGAVPVLRILAPLPLMLMLATLASTTLIHLGLSKTLMRIYFIAGVLSLMLLPLLARELEAVGAATSLLIVETAGPLMMLRAMRQAR